MRSGAMRRLAKDESGMAMGLAIITMVLIGVMGAGLLTFVVTDLNAVVEVNQGQRAFEVADAGVQAAKRQLASNSEEDSYDGGSGDVQWSLYKPNTSCPKLGDRGMCLENLDATPGTDDSVNVTIEYQPSGGTFKVVSTGGYGDAKRKVEAIFQAGTGTGVSGIPAHYTPGGIQLKKDAALDVSFFSGKNIEFGKGSLVGLLANPDPLKDWNRPPYNTTSRKDSSKSAPYTKTGLAAEGYVCSNPCKSSIADGVIAYDSTTGPGSGKGNEKTFTEKTPPTLQPQDPDTITYPFSRVPNVDGLLEEANSGLPNVYKELTSDYSLPGSASKRVVFIDAKNNTVNVKKGVTYKGILVVRCGSLDIDKDAKFEGIVMLLKGDDKSCSDTGKFNVDKNYELDGYIYAESDADDAMYIKKEAILKPPPTGEYDDYLKLAYKNPVELQSWRELYE